MKTETVTFTAAPQIMLTADRHGPEDGAPVILLHGGGQTRWSWKNTAMELMEHGLCIYTIDMRGHGQSSWSPSRDYALDDFSRDIRAITGQLSAPPIIVGASLGGMAALLACGEEPFAACAGLVLVDVTFRLQDTGPNRAGAFMKDTRQGFKTLEEAAAAIAGYTGERQHPARTEGLLKVLRQDEHGRYYWHWDPAFIEGNGVEWNSAEIETRMIAAVRRVKCPTLAVRGGKSDVVSREEMARLAQILPHIQQAEIPGARHMVAADDNVAFNMAILPFISSCLDHRTNS
ncbi:peroxidase [Acidocella aquatica]|uniref:Peroxidase n=1 Tax=Acidocella aquatica TaxID=1922313 RepID=A0ABQ6A1K6_9PROT|nr:alpha/beta hydrolase [Acidocella aquatica]GLR66034.1 peroxidase [Acidocella aquatica]